MSAPSIKRCSHGKIMHAQRSWEIGRLKIMLMWSDPDCCWDVLDRGGWCISFMWGGE